jgi:hypothetical protein
MKVLLTTFKEVIYMTKDNNFWELFFTEIDDYATNIEKITQNMDKIRSGFNGNDVMMQVFVENLAKQYRMFQNFNRMCIMLGVDKF